jgi:hypothetical protein
LLAQPCMPFRPLPRVALKPYNVAAPAIMRLRLASMSPDRAIAAADPRPRRGRQRRRKVSRGVGRRRLAGPRLAQLAQARLQARRKGRWPDGTRALRSARLVRLAADPAGQERHRCRKEARSHTGDGLRYYARLFDEAPEHPVPAEEAIRAARRQFAQERLAVWLVDVPRPRWRPSSMRGPWDLRAPGRSPLSHKVPVRLRLRAHISGRRSAPIAGGRGVWD